MSNAAGQPVARRPGPTITVPTPLELVRAGARDATAIVTLRDGVARWLLERGIVQWQPGEVNPDVVATQAAGGQWFVLRGHSAEVIATAQVINADPQTWGPDLGTDGTAGYLHGLMVHRDHAGQGLGPAVLRWFESFTWACGRSVARLDCQAHNQRLRAFYRAQGYRPCGINDFGGDDQWRPVLRLQKDLHAAQIH